MARRHDPRPLMLKIRVVPTRPMRKSEMFRLVETAFRRRLVPEGIDIRWVDWQKGTEGRASGRISDDVAAALADFHAAMRHAGTEFRIEKVSQR